jgi:hypothetical protein
VIEKAFGTMMRGTLAQAKKLEDLNKPTLLGLASNQLTKSSIFSSAQCGLFIGNTLIEIKFCENPLYLPFKNRGEPQSPPFLKGD